MNLKRCQSDIVKSALFVDFDNIFIGLLKTDPGAAKRFAKNPGQWLNWIESGMLTEFNNTSGERQRATLIRRCYLSTSRRYSVIYQNFAHSGFSVMACPTLTYQGKNSADIHMVIDMLDTLQHYMHIDEFIVMSGDSDFTPALLRLRAYDRRTTIISVNSAIDAYKAASDQIISGDVFINHGLGRSTKNLLDEMAQRIYAVARDKGSVGEFELPGIFREFPDFKDLSDIVSWLGFETLRKLTEELVRRRPGLHLIEGHTWKITIDPAQREELHKYTGDSSNKREATPPVSVPKLEGNGKNNGEQPHQAHVSASVTLAPSDSDILDKIIAKIQEIVAQSPQEVSLIMIGSKLGQTLGKQAKARWDAEGGFRKFIQNTRIPGVELMTGTDGQEYLCDPTRRKALSSKELTQEVHVAAAAPAASTQITSSPLAPAPSSALATAIQKEETSQEPPFPIADLLALIQKVHQVTKVPILTSEQYGVVFQAISDALQTHPYSAATIVFEVQKRCLEQNVRIVQAQLALILKGLEYAGHTFGVSPEDDAPPRLAIAFRNVIIRLCRAQQCELSADERRLIDHWLGGAIPGK